MPSRTTKFPEKAKPIKKKFDQTLKTLAKDIKAKPGEKPAQFKIDKYLAKIEEKKKAKAFERRPAAEVWKRPEKQPFKKKPAAEVWKRPEKKIGGKKAGEKPAKKIKGNAAAKKGVKWSEKIMAMPKKKGDEATLSIPKKIAFLPSALTGAEKAGKGVAPAGKKGKKAKRIKLSKLKPAELETLLGGEPGLAGKSVSELKKLSTKEIKAALKKESIKRKARGWFGDALQHRRAALKGWQRRKKIVLHKLKKKGKRRKLNVKDRARKKVLYSEAREYKVKLADVEKQISSLKKIGVKKKKESKALVKKIRKAGVKIPKSEIVGKPKKRSRIKDMKDVAEIAEAMKSVADEVAAATIGRKDQSMSEAQTFSIEDQIKSQQTMIKDLELAFYKRRVGFSQFREKMFEYQSKLSQLRIQRKLLEKKKILKPEPTKPREIAGRITPEGVRKLGAIASRGPGFGNFLGKKTSNLIEKIGKQRFGGRPPITGETPTPGKVAGAKAPAEKAAEAKKTTTDAKTAKEKKVGETKAPAEKAKAVGAKEKEVEVAKEKEIEEKKTEAQDKAAMEKAAEAKKAVEEKKARAKKAVVEEKTKVAEEKKVARKEKARAKKQEKAATKRAAAVTKEATAKRGPEPRVTERIIERPAVGSRETRGFKKLPEKFVDNIKKKVFERAGGKDPESEPEKKKDEEKKLNEIIKQKALEGHLSKKSINKVEKKLDGLMKKYHIPANAISNRVNSMSGDKLIHDFQKLINLIEEKKGQSTQELLKPFDVSIGLTSKKREKIIGKEKEIKKIRIETTFDRVLSLVQVKGSVKLNDVANQLGMKKKEVQECAEILENNHLIKLIYPAIGSVRLVYPGYLKWKDEQKKQKKKAKKGRK